jgi:drug/metabolite transporter (DMT)-like permease
MMTVLVVLFSPHVAQVNPQALAAVFLLGAFATGLAFLWSFRIIALAGSVVCSAITYVTPVVSTFLGIAVLGEAVTWNQPVGAVIVLVGAGLVQGLVKSGTSGPRPSSASASARTAAR